MNIFISNQVIRAGKKFTLRAIKQSKIFDGWRMGACSGPPSPALSCPTGNSFPVIPLCCWEAADLLSTCRHAKPWVFREMVGQSWKDEDVDLGKADTCQLQSNVRFVTSWDSSSGLLTCSPHPHPLYGRVLLQCDDDLGRIRVPKCRKSRALLRGKFLIWG